MSEQTGAYTLGPEDGALRIQTRRSGAAAKAGHDLLIEVTAWHGELTIAGEAAASSLSLSADPTSLRVLEGTGGMQPLGEKDKDSIRQTIVSDVLGREEITFRSSTVTRTSDGLAVEGELRLNGRPGPVSFELALDPDGRVAGSALVTQSAFGMKPYSVLFGTLRVADEVEVSVDARLPQS